MDIKKDILNHIKSSKRQLIVILGPTASGKTALSLKIAHEINGEIISTDSRQIYEGMEIGTDAIPKEKREGIPHHLIGIVAPDKAFTLAEYKKKALGIIEKIYKKKKIPILVGGTGLYISAIIEGYDVPKAPPNENLRKTLSEEAKKFGNEYIYEKLKKIDPIAAKSIHPNNTRYVIRAIEINAGTGKNKKDIKKRGKKFDALLIGIFHQREKLYKRVEKRVDLQIENGLIEEVKALLEKGYDETLPAMTSLGVKEIIPYIKGKSTLPECIEILKRNTRRYAKRQMTWFKRYDNVAWLTPEELKKFINE